MDLLDNGSVAAGKWQNSYRPSYKTEKATPMPVTRPVAPDSRLGSSIH